jgi:hypothetical protein
VKPSGADVEVPEFESATVRVIESVCADVTVQGPAERSPVFAHPVGRPLQVNVSLPDPASVSSERNVTDWPTSAELRGAATGSVTTGTGKTVTFAAGEEVVVCDGCPIALSDRTTQ